MTSKIIIGAVALMALTITIGLAPATSAWWGYQAWDMVNVIAPSNGSSIHSHTEKTCDVLTKIATFPNKRGDANYVSWKAPSTCDGKPFAGGTSILSINGEKVKTYYFYAHESMAGYSYGDSEPGDKIEVLNLFKFRD